MRYLVLIIVSLFTFFILSCNDLGKKKQYGNMELYYTTGITEEEAGRLGSILLQANYDDGDPKTVQLSKSGDAYILKCVVKDGLDQDPHYVDVMGQMADALSTELFDGAPVAVHACDKHLKTLKVVFSQRSEVY